MVVRASRIRQWTAALALLAGSSNAVAVMDQNAATDGHDLAPDPLDLSRYVGQLGSFSGTPISSRYFVSAAHLGGGFTTFTYANGTAISTTYSVSYVGNQDDLALWKISDSDPDSFSLTAPIYTQDTEVGQPLVALGRGTTRGPAVYINNVFEGWQWGNSTTDLTWGTNTISSAMTLDDPSIGGELLTFPFIDNGDPHTASLSGGDSGGAVFVLDPADNTYKLAGVNTAVDGPYSFTADGPQFNAALFDTRGLYIADGDSTDYIDPAMNPTPVPTNSYTTDLSSRLGFLETRIGLATLSAWKSTGGGDWNSAANWNATPPNGMNAEADFVGSITGAHTVFTDTPITLATLRFNNVNKYLLTGTGSLTLQSDSGPALVEVEQGNHEIDLATTILGAASFNIAGGAGLVMNQLTVSSGGTATIVAHGSTPGGVLQIRSLTVQTNAKLDVADNALVITDDSAATMNSIRALLASGFNGGAWNGNGIDSSIAAEDSTQRMAVGYADNAVLGYSTFAGAAVPASSILIRYTFYGDSNLDGKVDVNDFRMFLDGLAAMNGSTWEQGDYTYDGHVDLGNDFNLFLTSYLTQGGALGDLAQIVSADNNLTDAQKSAFLSLVPSSVPEPATTVVTLASLALLPRRTRRQGYKSV